MTEPTSQGPHPLDKTDYSSAYHKPLPSEVPVTEPKPDRKCTDVYCLVIFLFVNACLWTLSGWSYKDGNPQRLVHGWDINGNFCGTGNLRNLPYTYFPIPLTDIDVTVCLPGCPVVNAEQAVCLYDRNVLELPQYGCFDAYPSRPFYNNYCLPADNPQRRSVIQRLYSEDMVMTRTVGDLARAWDELAIGGLIAFGAMMVYFFVFKIRCKSHSVCTLPFYILSVLVLFFLFAVLCYELHEENWTINGQICEPFGPVRMDQCDEGDTAHGSRDLAWTVASIGFACGLAILCMFPKVPRGHNILKNAGRVFGYNPLPLACPLAGLILGVSFYAYFISFLIFTVSSGTTYQTTNQDLVSGFTNMFEFHTATRVLVFFDVAVILWWFSFIAHAVEFVTASTTAHWFFGTNNKEITAQVRRSLHTFFRYHLGSVLLASVLVPSGRFWRNLFAGLKVALRALCQSCLGCSMVVFKPCLSSYEHWFKYMTSDGMAYQAIMGGTYLQSAKQGYHLVKRQDSQIKAQVILNSGNVVIWLFQLVIMLSGVVFVAWWLQYAHYTFKGLSSFQVTSVTAMAIYELFITWFFAQLYGAYVRGCMHASVIAYLIDVEVNNGKALQSTYLSVFMSSNQKHELVADGMEPSKPKSGESKVAPAPVVSEGLIDKPPEGPGIAGLISSGAPQEAVVKPETAPAGPNHPPATAAGEVHPATTIAHQRVETNQSVGEEVELIKEPNKPNPEYQT